MNVHFDSISIVITDKDEETATVRVTFDPPVPDNISEEEFEENIQPCSILAFSLLKELERTFENDMTYVQEKSHTVQ